MAMTEQDTILKPGYKQTEVGMIPEDWGVKKFGEIFQFLNTANNSRSDLSQNGDIEYIHYGDIHTKWRSFLDCSSDEIPLIQSDKVRNAPFLEDGDLVMADASEDNEGLGISVEVKNATGKKVVAGLHTFLLRGNKEVLADGFKGYIQYIPNVKDSLRKAATGISVYGISKNNVRNILIPLPPIPEQQAIAAALSDMDALITSLDRLIAKKRDIKQATMQQLLTGKTRLSGFSGEWEVKKVGEVLRVRHGKSQQGMAVNDGKYPILATGGEIGRTNNYIYDKPSVLIGRKGTIDSPQYMDSPFWTIDTLFYTEISDCAHPRFVFYLFNMIDWYRYNEASGVPSLNASTIESIEIRCPLFPEQQAIATILSDMDAEIVILEQKRDKTRALKQGMMQELLSGKTRLL